MLYEIKTASSIFHRAMENILRGEVKNAIIYQDDVCTGASSKKRIRTKNQTCFEQILKSRNKYKPR